MKLKSSVQIALIIVAGIILLTLILIFTLTSVFSSPKDSLQVNGQSTIKVTPDLITLSYNVETKGNTSKEAEDLNSDIVNDLIVKIEIKVSKSIPATIIKVIWTDDFIKRLIKISLKMLFFNFLLKYLLRRNYLLHIRLRHDASLRKIIIIQNFEDEELVQ